MPLVVFSSNGGYADVDETTAKLLIASGAWVAREDYEDPSQAQETSEDEKVSEDEAQSPESASEEKPKRHRRTKAEIAADEAAASKE